MTQQLKIARLDDGAVAKIQELEQVTDKHIMAFEPGLRFANLAQGELEKIQTLEKELGVILIVYDD
ncbi:MAG: hypothetical protein IPK53_07255 [bacterium]|nr:hypothetical protein [bacterium]